MQYIGVGAYFLIAEEVLTALRGSSGHAADDLADATHIPRLLSALQAPKLEVDGNEVYASLAQKGAVLCVRLARGRPLPYDNTVVAFETMRQFIAQNGGDWTGPPGGDDEVVSVVQAMAKSKVTYTQFAAWVEERLG